MGYTGYVQGEVIILKEPLPVPDGTEVRIVLPKVRRNLLHAAVARPFATFGEVELYPTDFDKAAALFHALIKSHPFMDGTKRTAFAAAVYFLYERGYTLQRPFLKDEVIRFCVGLAEEGQRFAEGERVAVQTIRQIAEWFKGLVEMPASGETSPTSPPTCP